jgi:hypothetical protein
VLPAPRTAQPIRDAAHDETTLQPRRPGGLHARTIATKIALFPNWARPNDV